MANTREAAKAQTKVTPYFTVTDFKAAIAFYARAFGAVENYRLTDKEGRVGHAEMTIGNSVMMVSEEFPDFGARAPASLGGSPVAFHLAVENADAAIERAVTAGATLLRPASDQFYGERSGMIACPFGYRWSIAQPAEDISPAEMQRRWTKIIEGGG